jgi:heme/copper-type cytochrome/quinol oxidase subunit 2
MSVLFIIAIIIGVVALTLFLLLKNSNSKNKTIYILKVIMAILIVLSVGVIAVVAGVNIGGLINKLLGKNKQKKKAYTNDSGNLIGTIVDIINRKNPFRDKSTLKLSNGEIIKLPSGVEDSQVESVTEIKISSEGDAEYVIKKKHDSLTSVFDQ